MELETLPPGVSPHLAGDKEPAILVTGATGFIGRHIVARLVLARRRVAVLARSRSGLSPQARIEKVFGALAQRVAVIEGDLARPEQLKGSAAGLKFSIDAAIHCAAEPSFDSSGEATRAVHIEGPMALLEALSEKGLRSWSQISTAFVCGRRMGTVYESEGDVGQDFYNGYERLKLESEICVTRACAQLGIEWRIFRPGIVIGLAPLTKGGVPSNVLQTFVRMLVSLSRASATSNRSVRIHGCPQAPFNIVPVEFIAKALERLWDDREACGKIFHLVPIEPPTQAAMLGMISEQLGLRRVCLLGLAEKLSDPSPLESRIAKMLTPYRNYLQQDVRFDCANARRLLGARGVSMPVIDSREVNRLIQLGAGENRSCDSVGHPVISSAASV